MGFEARAAQASASVSAIWQAKGGGSMLASDIWMRRAWPGSSSTMRIDRGGGLGVGVDVASDMGLFLATNAKGTVMQLAGALPCRSGLAGFGQGE